MRSLQALVIVTLLSAAACGGSDDRARYGTIEPGLGLERVVLYRNGVGYFQRTGEVDGHVLRLKVRKDQINDLLKSLTIVDRKTGQAVSVSMPLDPQSWANGALMTLTAPGTGSLSNVLDLLRGSQVTLGTLDGAVTGRIVMVEQISEEPDPSAAKASRALVPQALGHDYKVTLLEEQELRVVRLSKVNNVMLHDGDLALQFHRRLDASAGEGMFQQVDIAIRLAGESDDHDLAVSYVVQAPMWKPTYRIVLPEGGKGQALLQGWAVVDNTSGEDWRNVQLSLTSGAPIAFRYDLHTPRDVFRDDLTSMGDGRRAAVSLGETSYTDEPAPPPPEPEFAGDESGYGAPGFGAFGGLGGATAAASAMPASAAPPRPTGRSASGPSKKTADRRMAASERPYDKGDMDRSGRWQEEEQAPAVSFEALRRSTLAQARASRASGLTLFKIPQRVTVPDGNSTMVAIVNQPVDGEETFMFRPGGAGSGYESNPYRVVRFKNTTPFVLEPGPISIYAGGSFVGEGLSEVVGAGTSATVPFAVEPGILVTSQAESAPEQLRLMKIVRGVIECERFSRHKTTWTVQSQTQRQGGFTVLIRHSKAGGTFMLVDRPQGTEDLPEAYLVPLIVPNGQVKGTIDLIEQTPSRVSLSIFDGEVLPLLEQLLVTEGVTPAERAQLQPLVQLRQELGRTDTEVNGLKRQQVEIDERAQQTRENLFAIENDTSPEAAKLRREQQQRLDEFTKESNRITREVVALESKALQTRIRLGDMLQNLNFENPANKKR